MIDNIIYNTADNATKSNELSMESMSRQNTTQNTN